MVTGFCQAPATSITASVVSLDAEVQATKTCIDPSLQWDKVGNVWNNAFIRTTLYKATTPLRWLLRGGRSEKP